jgi:signal transduction histidine kinase
LGKSLNLWGAVQQRGIGERVREPGDFPIIIASMPPNARQRSLVAVVIALLTLGIAVAIPFAGVQGPRIDAFLPVLQTVMCVADLITATLLFAQYSIQPQRALLVLASGYVCSGMFAFLQTLAFPGAYAPAGLFGSTDHAAWFFVFWHTTFPLAIIGYAVLKDANQATIGPGRSTASMVGITLACLLAVITGLTLLVTAGVGYLPVLYTGGITQQTLAANLVNIMMWLVGVAALVVLFFRRRSILDLWLIVTLVAWMPNFIVAALVTTVRFSLGWYMARGYALVASCTVLAVLLTETTVLYARLVSAMILLRRERSNRLMSVDAATAALAHEIKQPLSGVTTRCAAALNWLKRSPPNLEKVRECIEGATEAIHRTDEIISSVRGLIRKVNDESAQLQINDVAQQVLALVKHDLLVSQINLTTEYRTEIPLVRGNRTLLQQVLLNLVKNAIEAMASVEDAGQGVSDGDRERIFDPFFTTKPTGSGLGLSICRAILEDHGGELRLAKSDSRGSVFQIILPTV